MGKLLEKIRSPKDLKALDREELEALCEEIRTAIIDTVSHNGGHLASNLGVVELTVALGMLNAGCGYVCIRFVFPLFFVPALSALIGSFLIEPMFRPYMDSPDKSAAC